MLVAINPSTASGEVTAPPSKSWAIRLALIASLAPGESIIRNYPAQSGDASAAIRLAEALGASVAYDGSVLHVQGPPSRGFNWTSVDLGGSGTTLRMGLALASLNGGVVLDGDATLRARPIKELLDALRALGAVIEGDFLPLKVVGGLRGGRVKIKGDISSQFVSSLMIAGIASDVGVEIEVVGKLVSWPYVHMTADALSLFGCKAEVEASFVSVEPCTPSPVDIQVPGDYSLAAFYVGAALISGGHIRVHGLPPPPPWLGDSVVVHHFKAMGADSSVNGSSWLASGRLSEFMVLNLVDSPDLAPVLAGAAAVGGGAKLVGLNHLAYKESNRLITVTETLRAFGVHASSGSDYIEVHPIHRGRRASLSCGGDHRIAMLAGMLGTAWGADVEDAGCVVKSNPNYWNDLRSLGVDVWNR